MPAAMKSPKAALRPFSLDDPQVIPSLSHNLSQTFAHASTCGLRRSAIDTTRPKEPVALEQMRRTGRSMTNDTRGMMEQTRTRMMNKGRNMDVKTTLEESDGWMMTASASDPSVLYRALARISKNTSESLTPRRWRKMPTPQGDTSRPTLSSTLM